VVCRVTDMLRDCGTDYRWQVLTKRVSPLQLVLELGRLFGPIGDWGKRGCQTTQDKHTAVGETCFVKLRADRLGAGARSIAALTYLLVTL
jgi:hypothetical protein